MQAIIDTGSAALEATGGGALVPRKCVAQVIFYSVHARNQWKFRRNQESIQLTMTSANETVPLRVSNPNETHKALGTFLRRDGSDLEL